MKKAYIGDSVYVEFDGNGLKLTTENGFGPSNTIYLEPEVYQELTQFVAEIQAQHAQERQGAEVGSENE